VLREKQPGGLRQLHPWNPGIRRWLLGRHRRQRVFERTADSPGEYHIAVHTLALASSDPRARENIRDTNNAVKVLPADYTNAFRKTFVFTSTSIQCRQYRLPRDMRTFSSCRRP
jgi:hypothetical protein